MKKRFLSMILAIAMVVSMLAGITLITSAAASVTAGKYVIAANIDGVYYAMPNAGIGTGKIAGEVITVTNGTVSEADAAAYVLNVAVLENGNITISNDEGKFLSYASSTNFGSSDNYEWTPTAREDGTLMYVPTTGTTRCITYRTGTTNKFAPYASSNIGSNAEYNNVELLPVIAAGACTHENAESTVTTPATCTTPGEATWTCSCGATGTTNIAPTGHNITEWTETVAPACTTKGEKSGVCVNCAETIIETVPSTGHMYGEPVVTAPTCTEKGYSTLTCTVCAYEKKTDETEPAGHTFADGICTVCGEAKGETITYSLIDLESIVEGNYVIAAVRSDAYPTVYTATAKVSGDWTVCGTAVTVNEDAITSDELPVDTQVFAFKGNNTDGFTISLEAEGETLYLGVSDYSANRKLALSAEYANVLWTVEALEKGGFVLKTENYVIMQNSTTVSAIRGYKTVQTGTSSMGIYLFADAKGEVAPPCEHANTTEIPAVEATCTTDGNTAGVVCADCGEIISGNEVIPALGHNYSVVVADGAVSMACANCADVQAITLNTLAEAKAYTDKKVVYNVKGIVTYVNGRTVYIEDENDGLCVYFAADFDTTALNLGDEIFVSSTMTTYNTLPELNAPAAYYVLSTGNAVPGKTVALADLLADTANEYLGERVTISGLTVGTVNVSGSTMLTDEAGNSIALHKATGADAIISEGDVITVTAIVSIYKSTYQLTINPGTMASDIQVTSEGEAEVVETVSIADAKLGATGEYYQVEGVVTAMSADKRTIYIQDETGAIAVYLTAYPTEAVCAIGDEIKAYGSWKNYGGLIELTEVDASNTKFFEILSSGKTVEAQTLEIAALLADTTGEYMAEKVRIEGAVITEIAENGTVTLDQNGSVTTIYKAPALAEDCVVGATVNVTAVVSSYNNTIQLIINEAADVEYVVVTEPEPTEVTVKIGHTLNLASDISINFAVSTSILNAYDSYYMEFVIPNFKDDSGDTKIQVEPTVNGSYYYFTLTGITAVQMNDVIEARVYMTKGEEKFVSTVDQYSVGTYAYSQLNKAAASEALKALCADLLRYGAVAQTAKSYRMDALVDADMTEEMKAYLSDIEAVTFNDNKAELSDCENPKIAWKGRALDLNSKVVVRFVFAASDASINPENLTAKLTYVNCVGETQEVTLNAELYNATNKWYAFSFDQLLAAELRAVMSIVVYDGETAVSNTNTYSVDSYGVGKTGVTLDLCKAMIAYSDTALAFFG